MPLSGVFAWLVIIYMNRDRGDKETSSTGRISAQAGRRGGGRMVMEQGGHGQANMCRRGCVGLTGVFS